MTAAKIKDPLLDGHEVLVIDAKVRQATSALETLGDFLASIHYSKREIKAASEADLQHAYRRVRIMLGDE